jgi:hypothetical protein
MDFKFELDQEVTITASGESGVVVGCAHYNNADCSFLIRYKAGDGRAVESWWTEKALS